ncbi:MAG: phosphoethanolamine transferase CptA [Oscillospiraceae bacterium]|nr:phosphoethanolamine transferase CptA [Oscillospiraceae bacterium]
MNNQNPFSAYVIVSHISFIVITPLLLFIWGGTWLIDYLGLPSWTKIIAVLLGVMVMLASLVSYLVKLIAIYGDLKNPPEKPKHEIKSDRKDSDFYYD